MYFNCHWNIVKGVWAEPLPGCSNVIGCCVAEVLYEDLQYLSVSALALAALAALLMLAMWLLNKAYRKLAAWRRSRRLPGRQGRSYSWQREGLQLQVG